MQPGQRLDRRDDGRGIPGRAGSGLGCPRLRCHLRCRVAYSGAGAACGAGSD